MNGSGRRSTPPTIEEADWDVMFEAVCARLLRTVDERPGELPLASWRPAETSASPMPSVVRECVGALGQLHACLKQQRRHRPTP